MENITEKSIRETEAKTYAFISSVLIGMLITDSFILVICFIHDVREYLTYHNIADDNGGALPHYVNTQQIPVYGILGLVVSVSLIFLIRFYISRIKRIEKKKKTLIISILIMLVSFIVLGYFSVIVIGMATA